jgi:hypothetical protein
LLAFFVELGGEMIVASTIVPDFSSSRFALNRSFTRSKIFAVSPASARGRAAAELAMHFTRGHAHVRALHFHEFAAGAALDRHAAHEAVAHCAAARWRTRSRIPRRPRAVRFAARE